MFSLKQLYDLDLKTLSALITESREDGFQFLRRLEIEYLDHTNRFDQPGEALFAVYEAHQVIGIGGLNQDPFVKELQAGRVRRVYVSKKFRQQGVGRILMTAIIAEARRSFQLLTLRTDNPSADAFYLALGFHRTTSLPQATHILHLNC